MKRNPKFPGASLPLNITHFQRRKTIQYFGKILGKEALLGSHQHTTIIKKRFLNTRASLHLLLNNHLFLLLLQCLASKQGIPKQAALRNTAQLDCIRSGMSSFHANIPCRMKGTKGRFTIPPFKDVSFSK